MDCVRTECTSGTTSRIRISRTTTQLFSAATPQADGLCHKHLGSSGAGRRIIHESAKSQHVSQGPLLPGLSGILGDRLGTRAILSSDLICQSRCGHNIRHLAERDLKARPSITHRWTESHGVAEKSCMLLVSVHKAGMKIHDDVLRAHHCAAKTNLVFMLLCSLTFEPTWLHQPCAKQPCGQCRRIFKVHPDVRNQHNVTAFLSSRDARTAKSALSGLRFNTSAMSGIIQTRGRAGSSGGKPGEAGSGFSGRIKPAMAST